MVCLFYILESKRKSRTLCIHQVSGAIGDPLLVTPVPHSQVAHPPPQVTDPAPRTEASAFGMHIQLLAITPAYIPWTDHEGRGEMTQTGGQWGAEAGRPRGTLESHWPQPFSLSQDLIKFKKKEDLKCGLSSLGL